VFLPLAHLSLLEARALSGDRGIDSNGNCSEEGAGLRIVPMGRMPESLQLIALEAVPLVRPGDDLAGLLIASCARSGAVPRGGDVLVVAQKIVSKSEGRYVDLATVEPSPRAQSLAREAEKDARLVELILRESRRVVRHRPGVVIVEHRLGYVMANAGIDRSNIDPAAGAEPVLLLPRDPDASAAALQARLAAHFACAMGVIVSDSFGRAWRRGTVGIALGAAGLPSLLDLRGRADLYGRLLQVSETGFADEIAAAASLLMGQADEGVPAVLVRGLAWSAPAAPAANLVRTEAEDLFR
jgi:coenzyme F420-0:L-glutamate ligase/coenzyme F420-1:gamma-L-glutamate ligase